MSLTRFIPWIACVALALVSALALGSAGWSAPIGWLATLGLALFLPLALVGTYDVVQKKRTILRNYPVIGHGRYLMESVRPEIRQYFIEDDRTGRPFHREDRALIYQRAKGDQDYDPFGSELDVRQVGYEWIGHSMMPVLDHMEPPRVMVGEGRCAQPYSLSLLNISAMSFGSLGPSAVRAMGYGAKKAGFAHNTGEGGTSSYHLETGADLIWQVGTGYFGCRAEDGTFDAEQFEERARHPHVKMIEVKLSQGAKPGHGGILPAHKVTKEIADARGIKIGVACLSPPGHTAFGSPAGLVEFVDRLRDLSGGKPIGIKLCVGLKEEFMGIVHAMLETGTGPDFISVDGGEGGTGAAPPEFGDHVGMPLEEGLVFVRNALVASGLRERVTLIAAGKVVSAMDLLRCLALGADATSAARAFMMSIGCIQAQLCHTNHCPTGVATLDPLRNRGLDPTLKSERSARFQTETLKSLMELVAATGRRSPHDIGPNQIMRRVDLHEVCSLDEIHRFEEAGALLAGSAEPRLQKAFDSSNATSFLQEPLAPAKG